MRTFGGVALIVVITALAYWPAMDGRFIWDDEALVANNALVQAPDGLYRIWLTSEAIDYWPVTNTSFWIEWRLWGRETRGYHLTNLALHVAAAILIWMILRQLSIPGGFLAALLFAVHPVNVESVAWIAERKNALAMVFFLLSITAYLKFENQPTGIRSSYVLGLCACLVAKVLFKGSMVWLFVALLWYVFRRLERDSTPRPNRWLWYLLSLSAFVIAMLSKGSVAILPIILLLVIWWQRPIERYDFARVAPFLLVAAGLTAVDVWFQSHGLDEVIRDATWIERILGAGAVPWFYLYKALVPIKLSFVYPQWQIHASEIRWWLPLIATVTVTVALYLWRTSCCGRALLMAWIFYCTALLPVCGLVDVYFMKYSLVADHYQHIAIVGLVTLVASCTTLIQRKVCDSRLIPMLSVPATVVVATLIALTHQQAALYDDEATLYMDTLEKNPDAWLAHVNLGLALQKLGRTNEAIDHYRAVVRLAPEFGPAWYDLGVAELERRNPAAAVEPLRRASRFMQRSPDLPIALNNLGAALMATGRTEEATIQFQRALELRPEYGPARANLGRALAKVGHGDQTRR